MSARTSDYDYVLPEALVAKYPPDRREAARMLVVDRARGTISHSGITELPRLLPAETLVVLNNTKVIPGRLRVMERDAELLLLQSDEPLTWLCWVRPGKWFQPGRRFSVGSVTGEVIEVLPDGGRIVRFDKALDLEATGEMPLPPYLKRRPVALDRERYQTVYASVPGAIAAPTAGLHFTPELLGQLPHAFITLHVGPGTFQPVKTDLIAEHALHEEQFAVETEAAERINAARHVLAVGTTTVRTLEAQMRQHGKIVPERGSTRIFIYPPFQFQRVDALLTNFHLPRSTLLMLVAAFAGRELTLQAYAEAVAAQYRFFSYGDCMLIL